MNYQRIKMLQKINGLSELQDQINSGLCWQMEGSIGRYAMDCLESGVCMLPKTQHRDAYGSFVPSRDNLKKGSKGTYQNSVNYWLEFEAEN